MDKNYIKLILLGLAILFMLVSIYLAFIYTPAHETMGDVQRIFYFHVSSAWISYLAFGITFIAGLFYLKSQEFKWDSIAFISVEIGLIFCTIAIITGALWAEAVWGVFWIWEDMKLFLTLVLWLIYIAYLALRTNAKSKQSKAKLGAIFGIIGFICVPFSFAANRIWQQYHPTVIASSRGGLQASMTFALIISVISFTILYLYLMLVKIENEKIKDTIEEIKQQIGG